MKNKAKSIPKRLTGLTQLSRLPQHSFWADGSIWGCTARGLSESVAVVEGVKPDEKMQVLVDQALLKAPEVVKFLDGLEHAQIQFAVSAVEGLTLQELYAARL